MKTLLYYIAVSATLVYDVNLKLVIGSSFIDSEQENYSNANIVCSVASVWSVGRDRIQSLP